MDEISGLFIELHLERILYEYYDESLSSIYIVKIIGDIKNIDKLVENCRSHTYFAEDDYYSNITMIFSGNLSISLSPVISFHHYRWIKENTLNFIITTLIRANKDDIEKCAILYSMRV